jgi:DNA-binding transcriptional LysR family regulator
MNIDSDKALAFFHLAKEGSFSKASKSLGITQSALSQKIARLEDELEMTLVIRASKELVLTPSGQELIRYYQTKIELDQSFFNSTSSGAGYEGGLSVASYSSIMRSVLMPILAHLSPELSLRYRLVTKEVYELEELLLSGRVNFILTTEMVNRENVINELIGEEELVHIKPKNARTHLPFFDHDEQDATTFRYFREVKKEIRIERSFMDDIYGIIDAVRNGLGQAIVSKHLVRDLRDVEMVNYRAKVKDRVYLVYFDKVYYPKRDQLFLSLVRKQFVKAL